MGYFKRLKTSGSVSLEAFKMYYAMRAFAPSLHRESTDSLIRMQGAPRSYARRYAVLYIDILPGNHASAADCARYLSFRFFRLL